MPPKYKSGPLVVLGSSFEFTQHQAGKITAHEFLGRQFVRHGGFLVQVERADLGELMKKYPEPFNRPYHSAAGLRTERVLMGGDST